MKRLAILLVVGCGSAPAPAAKPVAPARCAPGGRVVLEIDQITAHERAVTRLYENGAWTHEAGDAEARGGDCVPVRAVVSVRDAERRAPWRLGHDHQECVYLRERTIYVLEDGRRFTRQPCFMDANAAPDEDMIEDRVVDTLDATSIESLDDIVATLGESPDGDDGGIAREYLDPAGDFPLEPR
ncbi:MAG: hypothetical protein ACM31C_04050 [Acidobacteriota bacterium]